MVSWIPSVSRYSSTRFADFFVVRLPVRLAVMVRREKPVVHDDSTELTFASSLPSPHFQMATLGESPSSAFFRPASSLTSISLSQLCTKPWELKSTEKPSRRSFFLSFGLSRWVLVSLIVSNSLTTLETDLLACVVLNVEQFGRFMATIKTLGARIEQEHAQVRTCPPSLLHSFSQLTFAIPISLLAPP